MVRNRNGYFMDRRFLFAPDEDGNLGGGTPGTGGGGSAPADETNPGENTPANGGTGSEDAAAELEKVRAELAKMKVTLDKTAREAGEYRKNANELEKQLKAKMTQEEIDAANKKEAEEKQANELAELRKKVAKAESTKSVMAKLSVDENTAGEIAEGLAGCENIENVLLLIQKTWAAKEKALRLEFGKIPGPGTGGSNEDRETQEAMRLAKEFGQQRAGNKQSVRDQLSGLIR